jgi:mannose-6-phosphate isomerase-like protein (cupin superfamily)
MAIAKHITIFEKHIDLDTCCPVDMFVKRNAYSINPKEFRKYLEAADIAQKICQENKVAEGLEKDKLRTLQRGAFLKRDAKQGDIIGRDDLFFAFPIIHNFQYSAGTCSKYVSFQVMKDVKQNEPLTSLNSNIVDNTKIIESIRSSVKKLLDKNKVVYQTPAPMEISHHYGLDQFNNFGMSIITLVNNIYCKKLLILLPGQKNPEHYHKEKQETFFVLAGEAIITVDGVENKLVKGGLIHIQPGEVHAISSKSGTVIEELSSTHKTNDSYYVDERINSNNNRKTLIYV